ncbi:O-antigen ligase family protein [Dysgonomonas macrotermitis]|nr:O-antigen ligase family protein [Dysgonomonas macrotermitis]
MSGVKFSRQILLTGLILTGLICAVWGLLQLYGFVSSFHNRFAVTGPFFNPGPFAGYLSVIAPLAFYYAIRDFSILKYKFYNKLIPLYIRWGISSVCFISILLILPVTMSRASWLALLGGCICILIARKKSKFNFCRWMKRYRKRTICISSTLLIFILLGGVFLYSIKKDSADGRFLIWKISTGIIIEYPLGVGIGFFPGTYAKAQADYFRSGKGSPQEEYVADAPEYAFNEYLQIGIETGVLSLFIFVTIICMSLKNALKLRFVAELGSLVALLIFSFFSYPLKVLPFVILLCFLIASCAQACKEVKRLPTSIITVIASTLVGIFLYNRYPTYKAYKYWHKTKMLYDIGSYDKALLEYQKLMPYLKDQTKFLLEYSSCFARLKYYKESNEIIEEAILISGDPSLFTTMGQNYQNLGENMRAEICYQQALYTIPNRIYPYYLLGKLYYETGDYEKTFQMVHIVQTKKPKVPSNAIENMREEMKNIIDNKK